MSGSPPTGAGHNGGPPLDDDPPFRGRPACKWCRHWSAPSESERRAYEYFRLGLSRRRVKRPSGSCDRVLMAPGKPLAFSGTDGEFSCLNFSARPAPPVEVPKRGGFVTIWSGDRIVWKGNEEDVPEEYRD